jgi:hypothetical protein
MVIMETAKCRRDDDWGSQPSSLSLETKIGSSLASIAESMRVSRQRYCTQRTQQPERRRELAAFQQVVPGSHPGACWIFSVAILLP